MSQNIHEHIEQYKQEVAHRTDRTQAPFGAPQLSSASVRFEAAEKTHAIAHAGIPLIHQLAQQSGLVDTLNSVQVLKLKLPYYESDHILNIAFNFLCGGTALEHIEYRRQDPTYLNMLGTHSIPDPTTAGDFCRRYSASGIDLLQDKINVARLNVWARQPKSFFDEVTVDLDGTLAPTDGECKQGMDISYNGQWGYRPTACERSYHLAILRKTITKKKGQKLLLPEIRYYFYLTNDSDASASEIVFESNARCNQENLLGQLKSGMNALSMPLDTLNANGMYLVCGCLAWSLKCWLALWLVVDDNKREEVVRKKQLLNMEFRTFLQAMIFLPAQILRSGGQRIVRLLNLNAWSSTFFKLVEQFRPSLHRRE